MNQFKHLLSPKNIQIINPVYASLLDRALPKGEGKVVGWHMKSPSVLRVNHSMGYIEGIIENEGLDWRVEGIDYSDTFFVYINEKK